MRKIGIGAEHNKTGEQEKEALKAENNKLNAEKEALKDNGTKQEK